MLGIFSSKVIKRGHELEPAYLYACWVISNYQNGTSKVARKKAFLKYWGDLEYQFVAMVTKRPSSYRGAHLVEPYCKESNFSDTNWLRYPTWGGKMRDPGSEVVRYVSSSYRIRIWLSVRTSTLK